MSITTVQAMDTDDFLEHYGVKGMKWGQRKKPNQIHRARANVRKMKEDLGKQEDRVMSKQHGTKERAKEQQKYDKMKVDFLNNPDRATSARMTRGEAVLLGLFVLTPVGAAGAMAATRARSAHITSKQAAGDYNKKK